MNILDTLRLARAEIHNPGHARDRGLDVDQILQEAMESPALASQPPTGLRDNFAGLAMQAQCITDLVPGEAADALVEAAAAANQDTIYRLALNSYHIAEAMMRARTAAADEMQGFNAEAAAPTDKVDTYNAERATAWESIADKLAARLRDVLASVNSGATSDEIVVALKNERLRMAEALDAYDEENVPF